MLEPVLDRQRVTAREAEATKATPTLAMIDSQSIKTTEVAVERGLDVGKI